MDPVAATTVLAGTSLKAVARDWRERGIPSVTGAKWAAATVRDVLVKPAVAGLAVVTNGTATMVPAKWPAILEREVWEALAAMLGDPDRRTNGHCYRACHKD